MPKQLELVFDFGSPNAYLVHKVMPDFCKRNDAEVRYNLCLLGGIFNLTGNQAPMLAFANIPNKLAYESLETRRFIDRHGLHAFTMNPHFPVNTVQLMRGAIAAEQDGYLTAYLDAMTAGMWEKGLKLDDPEVLAAAYADAGFDADKLMAQLQDQQIKDKLKANTQAAADRGVFGSPTFFVGDEMFFGKERMGQVEEYLRSGTL